MNIIDELSTTAPPITMWMIFDRMIRDDGSICMGIMLIVYAVYYMFSSVTNMYVYMYSSKMSRRFSVMPILRGRRPRRASPRGKGRVLRLLEGVIKFRYSNITNITINNTNTNTDTNSNSKSSTTKGANHMKKGANQ